MEVRYVPGTGTLLGAGNRWLLLDADPDPQLLDRVWDLMTAPVPAADRVVETLVGHYGDDVSFALLDLSPGLEASVSRGGAQITTVDGTRSLTLRGHAPAAGLRLVSGIVPADSAELRGRTPVRPPAAPSAPTPPPPAPATGLIAAVPPEILASRPSDPPPATAEVETADPSQDSRRRLEERIGHTVRRVPHPDHDGRTTHRPEGALPASPPPPVAPDHLHQPTHETVLAVRCPAGHVTAAFSPTCRVCGAPVPPQEPQRIPRPQLGVLRLPEGDTVPLDRGVVIGRQPAAPPETVDWPHLVRTPQEVSYVSRIHLKVELDGWLVLATDLGSRGGTTLRAAGRPPERIRADQQYVWEPGQVLDLADSYEIVYEVEA